MMQIDSSMINTFLFSIENIIKVIRSAEGLIVGTPVYFGTARGDVLSALQRI